ncbi:PepSY domain-containing protein [Williamsia maris]
MSQTIDPPPIGTPDPATAQSREQRDLRGVDPSVWQRLRPFLMRLHFYGGMLAGPFLLIAAVTGLLYTFTPQLDPIVFKHELKVDQVGDRPLPMSEQIARAMAAHPEGQVTSIRPPSARDETTQVVMAAPDVPTDYSRTVFVDPYSGDVRGALTTFGQWLPIRAWFDEFHRNLHLGEYGRNYSELAASWLWVVALGGLALWIGYRARTRKLRRLAVPDRDKSGRTRTMTWHGSVGLLVVVGLLGLSVTGLTWSRYAGESISELRASLSWTTPSVNTVLSGETPTDSGASHHDSGSGSAEAEALSPTQTLIGVDRVLSTAENAGLQGPMWLYPPSAAGEGWQVTENKRRAPTRYDAITVDPSNGQITDRINFSDWPLIAKMTNWTIDAHMGILFGIVNQITLALLMIGLITVIIRGYILWWRRRPTRRRGLPRAPRRGALAELKPIEALILIVVIAGIGWYVPLFGLSIAAFVLFDVTVGLWQRRETVEPEQSVIAE